jgi:protein-L-isoaspartate O-methyltransferase
VALTFRPSGEAVSLALDKLKSDGVVHENARLNAEAPQGLRREVAFYDRDFLYRLGRTKVEADVIASALALLQEHGLVESSAAYDADAVARHRDEVRATFEGTWTSLSSTMERLLYMLASVKRPRHLVELGSFWGYTLAWFAGPFVGSARPLTAERIVGIDVDVKMADLARANFAKLPNSDCVEIVGEDARTALEELPGR